ncbi:unnamed protein product [Paramecium sonneborni]|uniref:Uncharacterized protein n=1 Tax=Paramecium sonneborni TaxID=65129 RepID=A0A8S1PZV9_9CILI|nr:unnamed protein product [Paramecium sonneborni]
MEVIETLNKQALAQTDSHLALEILEQALGLLQYNADCGKIIDRNLIVTIIYNLAGVNQALCNLDKAAQYLEGTVFNLQEMIQQESNQVLLIKRMHLLAVVQLQYCGLLSQLNQHQVASNVAQSTIQLLNRLFDISYQYQSSQQTNNKKARKYQKGQYIFEEYDFKNLLLKRSDELLKFIKQFITSQLIESDEQPKLQEIANQIFCWKLNSQHNDKSLKQSISKLYQRSMIGLLNENEWLISFNVSNIMHIRLLTYEEVCLKGEILYEFSQKVLTEKLILLSMAYFSLASETRYLKNEQKSQFYHLKSIYIVSDVLPDNSPYLDHLIQSFCTHYQQQLETILEEQSFVDQSTKVSLKRKESLLANKENCQDHLKQLIESLSKDKKKKQESIQKTLNQLQSLKDKLNKQRSETFLKRFKTEPSLHFDKSDKNCKLILQQLMKQ